jgi:2-polyprenyl-3-methyl-5-hydroxy-6-metoxy-1,4-benzoquinol methylase
VDSYWNCNAAYHRWVLRTVALREKVLDVGCGEGLLVERLARRCGCVVGIDPDLVAAERASQRAAGVRNASVAVTGFEEFDGKPGSFDAVVFVATLHHLDMAEALGKAVRLLCPGGVIAVVGCHARKTMIDWLVDAARVIPAKLLATIHREVGDVGVCVKDPSLSLQEIRRIAAPILPGASIRRALFYRYLMAWTKP